MIFLLNISLISVKYIQKLSFNVSVKTKMYPLGVKSILNLSLYIPKQINYMDFQAQ